MKNVLYRIKRFFPLLAALAVVMWFLAGRISDSLKSDPEKITAIINDMVDSARRRHAADFLDPISRDHYKDVFHSNFTELQQHVNFMCLRYRKVEIDLSDIKVEMDPKNPDRAKASLRASVRLGMDRDRPATEDFINRMRKTDIFLLDFARIDGDWEVVGSSAPKK